MSATHSGYAVAFELQKLNILMFFDWKTMKWIIWMFFQWKNIGNDVWHIKAMLSLSQRPKIEFLNVFPLKTHENDMWHTVAMPLPSNCRKCIFWCFFNEKHLKAIGDAHSRCRALKRHEKEIECFLIEKTYKNNRRRTVALQLLSNCVKCIFWCFCNEKTVKIDRQRTVATPLL